MTFDALYEVTEGAVVEVDLPILNKISKMLALSNDAVWSVQFDRKYVLNICMGGSIFLPSNTNICFCMICI